MLPNLYDCIYPLYYFYVILYSSVKRADLLEIDFRIMSKRKVEFEEEFTHEGNISTKQSEKLYRSEVRMFLLLVCMPLIIP